MPLCSLEYYGLMAGQEYEWAQLMELARTRGSDLLMGIVTKWVDSLNPVTSHAGIGTYLHSLIPSFYPRISSYPIGLGVQLHPSMN